MGNNPWHLPTHCQEGTKNSCYATWLPLQFVARGLIFKSKLIFRASLSFFYLWTQRWWWKIEHLRGRGIFHHWYYLEMYQIAKNPTMNHRSICNRKQSTIWDLEDKYNLWVTNLGKSVTAQIWPNNIVYISRVVTYM